MTYQPFLNDPERISALDRQRFVVLRAPSIVSDVFTDFRQTLRQQLDGARVSYPAVPHVTLCGFAAGVPLQAVQQLVASWALTVPPLRIEVARASSFPPPFQIVIVEIRKNPELFSALSTLRARAEQEQLAVSTVMPVEKWTFHLTVANCDKLN